MPDNPTHEDSVPAVMAPPARRDNPWTRSRAGLLGAGVLLVLVVACVGSLPWTLASAGRGSDGRPLPARYKHGDLDGYLLPPTWVRMDQAERARFDAVATNRATTRLVRAALPPSPDAQPPDPGILVPTPEQISRARPYFLFGTDKLGRDLFVRCLTGGGVSIGVGLMAAAISVLIGTLYGTISGYAGGRTDAVMMRIVDVLYGLPYLLLVVLLAVAGDSLIDRYTASVARHAQTERQAWMFLEAFKMPTRDSADAASSSLVDESTGLDVDHPPVDLRLPQFDPASLGVPDEFRQLAEASFQLGLHSPPRMTDARQVVREITEVYRAHPETGMDVDFFINLSLDNDPDKRAALEARASANPDLPSRTLRPGTRSLLEVLILLSAIGGLSWLTMARVIRGQVLSLKAQPFMEAARAMGVPLRWQFLRHLLPNLLGSIIVYATLTVPQAILQESFLSFLGIGIRPPLPSWGNLAADGLVELNTVRIRWWLLLFPSLLLGITLLALNFVGEGLREGFDPRRARK